MFFLLFFLPDQLHQDSHFGPAAFLKVFEPHHRDVGGDLSSGLRVTVEVSELPLVQISWVDSRLAACPAGILRKFLRPYTDS